MMSASFSPTQETTHVQGTIPPFCKLLVPLDGTRLAEEALPVALAFARRAGLEAKLVLLHASQVEVSVYARGGGGEVPSAAQPQAAYPGGIAQRVKDEGVEVEVIDAEGDPASAIVDLASQTSFAFDGAGNARPRGAKPPAIWKRSRSGAASGICAGLTFTQIEHLLTYRADYWAGCSQPDPLVSRRGEFARWLSHQGKMNG